VIVDHLEVLVEEPSMEAALDLLLPKMLPDTHFRIHAHQGKADLLGKLPAKLKAYSSWIPKSWRILILIDRDDDDCKQLKQQLEAHAAAAGLPTRTTATEATPYVVVNRVAIEELEAWYFGDWKAVRTAFPRAPVNVVAKAGYRAPDNIKGGTWEAFERVLQQAGYFTGGLRKIEAARAVAQHMVPSQNFSPSFCALRDALQEMVA
jgi:uncharacterized protein DUF4276